MGCGNIRITYLIGESEDTAAVEKRYLYVDIDLPDLDEKPNDRGYIVLGSEQNEKI